MLLKAGSVSNSKTAVLVIGSGPRETAMTRPQSNFQLVAGKIGKRNVVTLQRENCKERRIITPIDHDEEKERDVLQNVVK
jgi:hypothetical protein